MEGSEVKEVKEMLGCVPDFSCPLLVAGGGKEARRRCARALLPLLEGRPSDLNSPDVLFIEESPAPGVGQVREAVELMRKAPAFLPRRVGIVENVSALSEAAQDALLKDLEEPAKRSSWILFAPSFLAVRPAVKSRSHCYFIPPKYAEGEAAEEGGKELISRLFQAKSAAGAVRLAMEGAALAKEAQDKKEFCFSLLSSLLSLFSKALREKDGAGEGGGPSSLLASRLSREGLTDLAERAKEAFGQISSNVSPQLVFESLFSSFALRWRF